MKRVYAKWLLPNLPADLNEFHISCGVETEDENKQYDPYTLDDTGSKFTINHTSRGYEVSYTAPSADLEKEEGCWLSPNVVCDVEAYKLGIR